MNQLLQSFCQSSLAGILVLAGAAAGMALLARELLNPALRRAAVAGGFIVRPPPPFSGTSEPGVDFSIGLWANTTPAEVRYYPDGIGIVHEEYEIFIHHSAVCITAVAGRSGVERRLVAKANGKRVSIYDAAGARVLARLEELLQSGADRS